MGKFSVVCCIEYGRLEFETCLMLTTLRRFGGEFADSEVFVVRGRSGKEISPKTMKMLSGLDAKYVYCPQYNPAPWFNYSNKVCAVRYLQDAAKTEHLVWLDSDILVAGAPFSRIDPDTDFAARCETLPPAVYVGDNTQVPYWEKICQLVGCRFEEIPWGNFVNTGPQQKLYFNSGVLVWRRSTDFASKYHEAFRKVIKSRYATHNGGAWFADQVTLSPLVVANRYKWRHLDLRDHHMIFPGQITGAGASPSMIGSHIIHYSKSIYGDSRASFVQRLSQEAPLLYETLLEFEKQKHFREMSADYSVVSMFRRLRQKLFAATVTPIKEVPAG